MGNNEYKKIVDEQSKIYDKERVHNYFLKTSKVFKKLIPEGKSVIEIGSGTGLYVIDFNKNNRYSLGIDYCENMNVIARRNAKKEKVKCKFLYSDVEKKINTKEKFDFALLVGDWEYFEKPALALKNVDKCLKKDGRVIISTLNVPVAWPVITFLEKTGIKKLTPAFWHYNSFSWRLKKYADDAGFYVEKSFFGYYFLDKVYVLRRKKEDRK